MWRFSGRISIGTLPIEDMLWPVLFSYPFFLVLPINSRRERAIIASSVVIIQIQLILKAMVCCALFWVRLLWKIWLLRNQCFINGFFLFNNMSKHIKVDSRPNHDFYFNTFLLLNRPLFKTEFNLRWLSTLKIDVGIRKREWRSWQSFIFESKSDGQWNRAWPWKNQTSCWFGFSKYWAGTKSRNKELIKY